MSGYIWPVLGILLVAVTKYLTSLRLRTLTERMHREQSSATELRQTLVQVTEKESTLKQEVERLQAKLGGLRNVVANLERSLQRFSRS